MQAQFICLKYFEFNFLFFQTPVYIYYESLCPDSQAFITKQLYPSMKVLKDHVDLNFIPFGKSTVRKLQLTLNVKISINSSSNQVKTQGSDVLFECHHGPNECVGNKYHACAISHIQVDSFQNEHTRETLIVDYINCLMTIGNFQTQFSQFARNCAETVGVKKFESIDQCVNTTEGSKLLEDMGEKTNKLEDPLRSVPTITIREVNNLKLKLKLI